jgi:membrane-associated phospholipid phosphatase
MSAGEFAHHIRPSASGISRRNILRLGGAGLAATALGGAPGHRVRAETTSAVAMVEPDAGTWATWLLASGDQLRPDAPPDAAATAEELTELHTLAAERDAAALDRVAYWDAGAPGYRWNELAMQHGIAARQSIPFYRAMALLNVAIYDATVAAWDAKSAYDRPRPAVADPALATALPTPASPSYPAEHAVAAGAAAAVLSSVFPDAAQAFAALAAEAGQSRVVAGVQYPSDVAAGLALGKQVGELAVARAEADGADAPFDPASLPTGPGLWFGTPAAPTMGEWQTWVLGSGRDFRPEPPPAWDSPERAAELAEVKGYVRDAFPRTELFFWPQDPAGRPTPDSGPFSSNQVVFSYAPLVHLVWGPELAQKLFEYRWDANPPRAARAYALVSVAGYDATVACWNAKFHYMVARPNQFDSTIQTVLPTYAIPDYPSGHAAGLGATGAVLAYLFPREAAFFASRAEEAAASRLWAGIHFRSACDAGLRLGRDVAGAVIARAQTDGAD